MSKPEPQTASPKARGGGRRWLRNLGLSLLLLVSLEPLYRGFLWARSGFLSGAPDRFDVYTLGGSVCAGWPWSDLSPPTLLSRMFEGRLGALPLEFHPLATEGESIYPQMIRFRREVAFRDPSIPGVVIVYAGHNDLIDPLEPAPPPTKPPSLTDRIVDASRVLTDASYLLRRSVPGGAPPYSLWHYEQRMRAIIEAAREAGLEPFLSTVASNVTACEPNLPSRVEPQLGPFVQVLEEGQALEEAGDVAGAIALYEQHLTPARHLRSVLLYRIAQLHRARKEPETAREFYWRALDESPVRATHRATRNQNAVVRRLAKEYDLHLIDAVAAFEEASPDGLLGTDFFIDGQHMNPAGVRLLTELFANALSERFEAPIRKHLSDDDLRALEPDGVARAYVTGTSWFFAVITSNSVFDLQHGQRFRDQLRAMHWFSDALRSARANFERALKERPDLFSVRLGLALVEAGLTRGIFLDEAFGLLATRWRLREGYYFWVPKEDLPELLEILQGASVPEPLITEMLRTHALVDPESPDQLSNEIEAARR